MSSVNYFNTGYYTEQYYINTTIYEGPFDLLLELIERDELDITQLALAHITDQYLDHLHNLQDRNPAEVSAFLVIAARLIQIKSAILLPRPPSIEFINEEDPGNTLVQQLIQYRRFKEIAGILNERDKAGLRSYLRIAPPPINIKPKFNMCDITLDQFVQAAREILSDEQKNTNLDEVISFPRLTIRERIFSILDIIRVNQKVSFHTLIETRNRAEIVVTFLALLELIKRHIIRVQQENLFSDIQFYTINEWEEQDNFELEYKE